MEREIYKQLLDWKGNPKRKPLILKGARQVGKTYIIKLFGNKEYEHLCYINFDERPSLKNFFTGDLDPERIIRDMNIYFEIEIIPEKSLIFFDEIQECPEALNSLKYFQEQAQQYHVICAGSLLGVKMIHTKGFPVGKVDFLELYPLKFVEFLQAIGKVKLKKFLIEKKGEESIPEPFHVELLSLLKYYFIVGGMPEAVQQFISNQDDLLSVRKIQKNILEAYSLDFAKHAPATQVMKISTIWNAIPTQLAKENKKFVFSVIASGARSREYEEAIQWLQDAGLIIKINRISIPKHPLEGYLDPKAFKIYLLDVGLLGAMSHLAPKIILEGHSLFVEFKGAFTENYVAQELTPLLEKRLYYWVSEGIAEVDFVFPLDTEVFPLEVKSGENKKKKSLLIYAEKFKPSKILRTSPMNFDLQSSLYNIPLYALNLIP